MSSGRTILGSWRFLATSSLLPGSACLRPAMKPLPERYPRYHERSRVSREHGMTRIGSGMALAFIALLPATAATAQQPVVVQGALCRGEEPFWQLEASRTTAVLNRLAIKGNREGIFHGAPQAFMFLQPAAVIWRGD